MQWRAGLLVAQNIFHVVLEMLQENTKMEEANWTLPIEPLSAQFPFFLGLRPTSCRGRSLRIYVYDTGNYSAGSLFCSAGQWGVEVALHRYLAASDCRTDNPDEAPFPQHRALLHAAHDFSDVGWDRQAKTKYLAGPVGASVGATRGRFGSMASG